MILFKQSDALIHYLDQQRARGKTLGFVPTMGALHEGHLTLLKTAREKTDTSIVSIFVNPTQFNDPADFKGYPVTIESDISLLMEHGADVLFLPSQKEIYPSGTGEPKVYDLGSLENLLEGRFRPGHFQGVCQVMDRLLGIVKPDELFMGRKDYQQCMVIRKLIELENLAIQLNIVETVREADGLAMSSRNLRLSKDERLIAPSIYKALNYVRQNIRAGEQQQLLGHAKEMLVQNRFRPDYLELADAKELTPVNNWDGEQAVVALVAAFLNEVRLIDNVSV